MNKRKVMLSLKLKIFLIALSTIVIICLLLISPLFSIKNIIVDSQDTELKSEIVQLAEERAKGENGFLFVSRNVKGVKNFGYLFDLRAKELEEEISFLIPEVKNIKVRFSFPNTLDISYDKRVPAYVVEVSGSYVCVDIEGVVLAVLLDNSDNKLPVVRGIDVTDYKVGQAVSLSDGEKFKFLKLVFNEIYKCDLKDDSYKLLEHIEILDISEYNKIWLFIDDILSVKLGDVDNISYKINALKEIVLSEEINGKRGQIDFSASHPIFKEE